MGKINGNYQKFELNNGLTVALQKTPTQTVAGRLRVNHGALHEKEGEAGIAHFLEHCLMSGGTEKYSPTDAEIARKRFGIFNAFTSLYDTRFVVDSLPEDIELYLDFVSELAFKPRLDSETVNQERQRVLRELADKKSHPEFKDGQSYRDALYGSHPYNHNIGGKESVVAGATVNDLKKFHKRGYQAKNMDLILVGALPSGIEDKIAEHFGEAPSGENHPYIFPTLKPLKGRKIFHTSAPELRNLDNLNESNALIYLGFHVPPRDIDKSYPIHVLNYLLGGSVGSRLFQSISQRNGLAYQIGSEYDGTCNKGAIHISGSVPSLKQDKAIDLIFEEMDKLKDEHVDASELDRISRDVQYICAKTLESNSGKINAIEGSIDKKPSIKQFMKKIRAVTADDLLDAANKYLPSKDNGNYVLLLRDPLKNSS